MEKLEGKVAIVTGGAMGNGLGIVKVFLRHKAEVVILDYSDELENTVNTLQEEYSKEAVIGYQVDIRDKEKVQSICDEVYEKYGHIDILINNAGVARLETFENMSDEIRDFHFDINIKGTWNVTKAVVHYMKKNASSSIVNLSSVTGPMVADSGEVAYATTKAALIGFTKGLAMELVDQNIRVNAIMPGYIHTPMVDGIAKETDSSNPEKVIQGIAAGIPMKRLGTIEELGELAAFLASEESSYITGQGIVIDGGSTLPETMSVGV
ncbi:MAG: SDR family oxidoreductase UcpA [Bacilli bacterium]|nr:SDR family oxidoreductase UcpA [Bacilli bacterium]